LATSTAVQLVADELLFTEVSPTTIIVTLDGAFLGSGGPAVEVDDGQLVPVPNSWIFSTSGFVSPPSSYGAFWQTWQRTGNDTFINLLVQRQAPHDYMPFFISLADPGPMLPSFAGLYGSPNYNPHPVVNDGEVVSTSPSTIWLYDDVPITEIGFVDLTDTRSAPDPASTALLLSIAGLALALGNRLRLSKRRRPVGVLNCRMPLEAFRLQQQE
jgi:hypothetical protein